MLFFSPEFFYLFLFSTEVRKRKKIFLSIAQGDFKLLEQRHVVRFGERGGDVEEDTLYNLLVTHFLGYYYSPRLGAQYHPRKTISVKGYLCTKHIDVLAQVAI